MKSSFLKNVLYNWFGLVVNVLYGFLLLPFIIRHLGNTNYGLWNLIASVAGYVYLLDFGIQSSVNRYMAKFRGTRDADSLNSVYCNALLVFGGMAVVAICGGACFSLFLNSFFTIPANMVNEVVFIYLLMVFYSALELPLSVFGSILYAYQRFDQLNLVAVGSQLLQALLLLLVLRESGTLRTFFYIIVGVGLLKYLVHFLLAHRVVGVLRFTSKAFSKELLKDMLRFSGVTFAAIIANSLIFKTDNVVIGMYLGPEAIAIYSIGFMITEYASQVVGKMCNTLPPKFSEQQSRGEASEQKALLLSSTRFATLVGFPIGIVILVVGREFIRLWLGPGYDQTYYVMAILVAARMWGIPTAPLCSMLYGIGSHYLLVYSGGVEAVLNLVLSLVLVRSIGLTGVAWGTFIPMLVCNVFFAVLVFRSLDLDPMQWLKKAVLPSLVVSALFLVIIYEINIYFESGGWFHFIWKVACMAVVYAVLFLSFGVTKDERDHLRVLFTSRLKAGSDA